MQLRRRIESTCSPLFGFSEWSTQRRSWLLSLYCGCTGCDTFKRGSPFMSGVDLFAEFLEIVTVIVLVKSLLHHAANPPGLCSLQG
jgi:hypothetical protein